ncbi:voltage-dependent anion channel-domain-containing protein [Dendryphion nanum]|uniref:Voltage-dependent anion channel-domain-containing protein n=1 Tax=Dendryphion nanum TaxID=256645 RepID=A0A9P9IIP4_9PLEO|nr:voltage-dependent anion channel-domain-containing protein [Dendryphion nanum]
MNNNNNMVNNNMNNNYNSNSNGNQQQRNESGQSSRTNTWVQDAGPRYLSEPPFYAGPTDANGYPIDDKGKQPYTIETKSVQPTPMETPRDSIDLEKQKDAHGGSHDAHGHDAHGHGGIDPHLKDPNQPVLPYGVRLRHFTWAWYTLTMSTGGIATLLANQPHAFPGLISIGAAFYIINLFFFAFLGAMMVLRFTKFPGSFKESLKHEREGLFFPTFWLSIATIITGTQKFVVQMYEANHPMRGWIITSMAIAFWIYVFCTFCLAIFQYSFLFISHTYLPAKMLPTWLLPVFPIMLGGTIASTIAADQPLESRYPILVAGLGCQGLGFTIAIIMYAHYIGRLMQTGPPHGEHRPGMFIGVGPPSFTILALLGMANALPTDFDAQGDGLLDGNLIRTLALVSALFLWVLAMWFFMIALIATLHTLPKYFHCGWWAMVFPNTGFVLATIAIGNALNDEIILFVANGMTIALIVMWTFVLYHHIRAVIVADIVYPGRDEDVAD